MVQIMYTALFLLVFISTVATTCLFIPDNSLECVNTLTSADLTHECTNTSEPFMFTGVTHVKAGETFIGVKRINKLTVSILNEIIRMIL